MAPSASISIGIDLGTSGVRASAIDAQGRELAATHTPLPPSSEPAPGWFEQQPHDWWQATLTVLDALPPELMQRSQRISVDGTSGTLLLVDEQGAPSSPTLMYNDRRAEDEASTLDTMAPPDAAVHSPNAALPKLMWLNGHGYRGRHALHQADWIVHRLGATAGISDENNCLKLGYDPVQRSWPDWMGATGIDTATLPKVVPVGHPIGELSPALRQRRQCTAPVTLIAGTTDSNAATLATGIDHVGDAATALGSTLVLKVLSERPVFSPQYGIYSHRIGDRWLVGGASNTGGNLLRRYFSDRQLVSLSAQIDPSLESGLDYYPLACAGERFPINDPALAPRLSPRPDDDARFLHGLLEGMAHIEQLGYQRLQALGAPYPRRILTTGGGAANETWTQIRERVIGVPVRKAVHSEAAYGAALVAAGRITW